MKKYFLFTLTALLFSLAQATMAQTAPEVGKFTLATPVPAVFYLHSDRPPEELDGPSTFDRRSFDAVFKGTDRFIGTVSGDVDVYLDTKSGCFYKENDRQNLYHLDLLGGGTDSFYGFTPTLNWNDGEKTQEIPFVYYPFTFGRCSDLKTRTMQLKKQLKMTGTVEGSNLAVYEPKNPSASGELKKLYKDALFPEGKKPSFQEYIKAHPLVYIYDNLGSFHRLLNSQFAPASEMGKPALYLYPSKETEYTVKVFPVGGKITEQIPVLENSTWKAKAKPTGEITVGGISYPYLYYESTTNQPMPLTKGVVIAQKEIPVELPKMLDKIGFKEDEKTEFLNYWLPRMTSKRYYAVQFLINEEVDRYSKLSIKPDLPIYRVFMNFQGYWERVKIPVQQLSALDRSIPHAFEWGGNNLAK